MIGLVSTIAVILFLLYSSQIKLKIVTYFTWGSIGFMLPFLLIVLSSVLFTKAPRVIFYLIVMMIGFFRCIFFQSLLIMIKMHKQIYDKKQRINQNNYKLLTNLWSAGYGTVISFFTCNWLEYHAEIRWEYLVIIAVVLKLGTTIMIFFKLRSYLEDYEDGQEVIDTLQQSNNTTSTLSAYFSLLGSHLPSRLYLINATITDALHISFCYALPVFFYNSGYKGSQGYLTAIYSISVVGGAYVLAISDYLLQKETNLNPDKKQLNRGKAFLSFIFSVSLFFFVVVLLLLTVISFCVEINKKNGNSEGLSVSFIMALMCLLGFFFGGPLKSYFSYKAIRAMQKIEEIYEKKIKNQVGFKERQEQLQKMSLKSTASLCQKISAHKLNVSSSLVATNRIMTYFITVIIFMVSFYLIDEHLAYTMVFFAIIGVMAFVFDVLQNWVAVKEEEKQIKQMEEKELKSLKYSSRFQR